MIEINKVKNIFDSHFQLILDFPTANFLPKILDKGMRYVWVINHIESYETWKPYDSYLYGNKIKNLETPLEARRINMEYLVETSDFQKLIPHINQSITIYQIDKKPPKFLDLNKLKGKSKYDLLSKELNYLFEIEIKYPADFAPIVSPNKDFLDAILINNDIHNLP